MVKAIEMQYQGIKGPRVRQKKLQGKTEGDKLVCGLTETSKLEKDERGVVGVSELRNRKK